jgi:hypothetical protein
MIVLYNFLIVIIVAIITWLGIKFTNLEEYFVALGVINIVYLICVFVYMLLVS